MKLQFKEVYDMIQKNPNLVMFFNWYISHCESLNVPYHNLSHTLGMMRLVIEIYKRSQYKYKDYGFKLSDEELYLLLVSALFHDYNHSAGKFDDEMNVNIAIAGLRDCLDEILAQNEVSDYVFNRCSDIIRATQYPYVIESENLDILQTIIRECDILVVYYDNFITHNIFGLMSEMNTGLDIKQFAAKYISFVFDSLAKLKLVYSQEIIKENQDEFLQTIDSFSKLLLSS